MTKMKSCSFLLILLFLLVSASAAQAIARTFHSNGKIESETTYNQQTQAKEKSLWYDQNGSLQAEEKFSGDTSRLVTFYNEKGQREIEETIVDGKRVRVRAFHANGNVKIDYTLKDGNLDGTYKEYREDGQIFKEIDYKGGKEI